jgi:EmrB/QacA subfamily drug resistance transporter
MIDGVRGANIDPGARRWWVLAAMTGTMSMMLIDATGVSVALPTIQKELGATASELRWIMNAYLLAVAALIALGGRLADIFAHSRIFVAGVIVFLFGSCAAGAAPSESWLIGARVVQGAGAAAMVPAAMTLVTDAFPASERGRAMGIYTGISMGFLALGPVIGGVLTDLLSWRAVFFINLPVGLAILAVTRAALSTDRASTGGRLDWPGLLALVAGLSAVIVALMQGPIWGWGSAWFLVLFIGGLAALAAFVAIELRTPEPLLQLRLFSSRNFTTDLGVLAAVRFVLMGLTVLGAIWIQDVLGFGPAETGFGLLALTIPMLIVAPWAGRLYDRIGPRWPVAAGAAMVALGFGWLAAVLGAQSYWLCVPGLVVAGVGIAPAMVPASSDSLNQTPAELRAEAAGASQTVRQVGATLGLSVMLAVSTAVQEPRLEAVSRSAPDPAKTERALTELAQGNAQAVADLPADDRGRVDRAVSAGVSASFWLAAGLMLVASIGAALMLRRLAPLDPRRAGEAPPGGDPDKETPASPPALPHHLP